MEPSSVDKALHLALFVVGALVVAVAALALLERFVGGDRRRAIGVRHVAIPIAAFAAIGIAERLYHALS